MLAEVRRQLLLHDAQLSTEVQLLLHHHLIFRVLRQLDSEVHRHPRLFRQVQRLRQRMMIPSPDWRMTREPRPKIRFQIHLGKKNILKNSFFFSYSEVDHSKNMLYFRMKSHINVTDKSLKGY